MKSPSNCSIEFCNRSQKSASEVEPKTLGDLSHAKMIGTIDITVVRRATAKRVGLYCRCCEKTSFLFEEKPSYLRLNVVDRPKPQLVFPLKSFPPKLSIERDRKAARVAVCHLWSPEKAACYTQR